MSRPTIFRLTALAGAFLYLLAGISVHSLHTHGVRELSFGSDHHEHEEYQPATNAGAACDGICSPQYLGECQACRYLRTVQSVLPAGLDFSPAQQPMRTVEAAAPALFSSFLSAYPIRGPPHIA